MLCKLIFMKWFHKITSGIFKDKRLEDFCTGQWFIDDLHGEQ